jgi:hypothetical protein
MNTIITIENILQDSDLIELEICISTIKHKFTLTVYTNTKSIDSMVMKLRKNLSKLNVKTFSIQLGEFSKDTANGTFSAKFSQEQNGIINIAIKAETDYYNLNDETVADRFETNLKTEPNMIDSFLNNFPKLKEKAGGKIYLECLP